VSSDIVSLVIGLVLAAAGGELFVRGVVGIAAWARVPAGIIGATVAAFATSSPELTVATNAAADGQPELALGDALGSNVVNLGLVIGVVLLIGPIESAHASRRDAGSALVAAVLLLVLALDGGLSRADGVLLLAMFVLWLGWSAISALRGRSDVVEVAGERRHGRSLVSAAAGLVCLVAAGHFIVEGAKPLGAELGIDPFVVGVVIVSIGTSMPELATAVASKLKGHTDVGLGTALGSNVFNTTFIVGVAAVIAPIDVVREVATSLVFSIVLIPVLLAGAGSGPLRRWRGAVLVSAYVLSIGVLLVVQR
jgi:cation:H+ antiporter